MSGVYIRGIVMPEEGNWRTIRIYPSGECAVPNWQGDCTLIKDAVAVPVPNHGRLIDADILRQAYEPWPEDDECGITIDMCTVAVPVVRAYIDDQPTIIPADKEVKQNDRE